MQGAAGFNILSNEVTISGNNFGADAGGRTRVSQITTLIDGKILGADDATLFENVGSGSATYANNKVNLSVTSGQYEIRQSKRFCPYFAGKSQLVECTFDNFQTEANVTKRAGYYSSSAVAPYTANLDGFFIENANGVFKLKAYRNGTQTIDVNFTDMTNYSEIASYEWANFTVVAFDFLWLGGAVLRFFVKTAAGFKLIHVVNYSGTATDTFILSPNQPIRYEIISTTGSGSFRYICSQAATEGSINEAGKTLSLPNYTGISCSVVGTIYALKGVKKVVGFRDTAVQILDVAAGTTAKDDSGLLFLIVNPTLSAPLTYASNSKVNEGTATNQTITQGTGRIVCSTPINVAGSSNIIKENFLSFLSQSITDSMDEYVLGYMPFSINQTIYGVISLKEY